MNSTEQQNSTLTTMSTSTHTNYTFNFSLLVFFCVLVGLIVVSATLLLVLLVLLTIPLVCLLFLLCPTSPPARALDEWWRESRSESLYGVPDGFSLTSGRDSVFGIRNWFTKRPETLGTAPTPVAAHVESEGTGFSGRLRRGLGAVASRIGNIGRRTSLSTRATSVISLVPAEMHPQPIEAPPNPNTTDFEIRGS